MNNRFNSLVGINISGRLSAIRKILFRMKHEKLCLSHIINSLFLIIVDRIYDKLTKADNKFEVDSFIKKWMKSDGGKTYFDFNGALLPDIRSYPEKWKLFYFYIFEDTFLIDCFYGDDYSKRIVDKLDKIMNEGPYGYTDKDSGFDVTVKTDDVVIDAGAWIGDFSAYAVSKGACVYAFEPVAETYDILVKTAELNQNKIIPVKTGLGAADFYTDISLSDVNSGGASVIFNFDKSEKISVTSLDKYVRENGINKVDFIKADIEGAERDMLKGAEWTLKNFAPRLALCTYHLPDDPRVLEELILGINPKYRIVHLRHKLFACV